MSQNLSRAQLLTISEGINEFEEKMKEVYDLAQKSTNQIKQLTAKKENLEVRLREQFFLAEKRVKNRASETTKKCQELSAELNRTLIIHESVLKSKQALIQEKEALLQKIQMLKKSFETQRSKDGVAYQVKIEKIHQKNQEKIKKLKTELLKELNQKVGVEVQTAVDGVKGRHQERLKVLDARLRAEFGDQLRAKLLLKDDEIAHIQKRLEIEMQQREAELHEIHNKKLKKLTEVKNKIFEKIG